MKYKLCSDAKLNLFLHLVGRNENNYHLIQSVMYFLDLQDKIYIEKSDKLEVNFLFNEKIFFPEINKKENSVIKIVEEFCAAFDLDRNFSITVEKNIPSGAGLGGGSANSATILNFLIEYYKIDISEMQKRNIALKTGCDTIACLYKYPIFVGGIGEIISKCLLDEKILNSYVLLIYPQIFSSSIEAYKLFKKNGYEFSRKIECYDDVKIDYDFLRDCRNDLLSPALELFPKIGELLNFLNEKVIGSGSIVRMSGSGSTCFAMSEDRDLLSRVKDDLHFQYPEYFCAIHRFIDKQL